MKRLRFFVFRPLNPVPLSFIVVRLGRFAKKGRR
jgi:hypothetical protein